MPHFVKHRQLQASTSFEQKKKWLYMYIYIFFNLLITWKPVPNFMYKVCKVCGMIKVQGIFSLRKRQAKNKERRKYTSRNDLKLSPPPPPSWLHTLSYVVCSPSHKVLMWHYLQLRSANYLNVYRSISNEYQAAYKKVFKKIFLTTIIVDTSLKIHYCPQICEPLCIVVCVSVCTFINHTHTHVHCRKINLGRISKLWRLYKLETGRWEG